MSGVPLRLYGRHFGVSDFEKKWKLNPLTMLEICHGRKFADSESLECRPLGGKHRKGQLTVKSLRFEWRNQSSFSKISGSALKNSLSTSSPVELVETFRRQAVVRKRGVFTWRLYAAPDPYQTLGVPTSATSKEIKQAYRRLALKYHPDVNKEPDAQQKFMQLKNAYQILVDKKSRAEHDAGKGASSTWDPFSWDSERKSPQKPQEEEFYGFDDFFRDLQADSRKQSSKPKSLWEELADIGEEFVEFLEKELNINDSSEADKKNSGYEAWNDKKKADAWDSKKRSGGPTQNSPQDQMADKAQVETEIAEIEDMLAKLKEELGI